MLRPISSPATGLPATRCDSISFVVRLRPMACRLRASVHVAGLSSLLHRHERPAPGADIIAARTDQAVVGMLLDDVGGPAGDARHRDDRGELLDRDAERVEEG